MMYCSVCAYKVYVLYSILGFRIAPPVVGRKLNLTELKPVTTTGLQATYLKKGMTCTVHLRLETTSYPCTCLCTHCTAYTTFCMVSSNVQCVYMYFIIFYRW